MTKRPDYVLRNARWVPPEEYSYSRVYSTRRRRARWITAGVVLLFAVAAALVIAATLATARAADRIGQDTPIWTAPTTIPNPDPTTGGLPR
jgi:hypothetical protein